MVWGIRLGWSYSHCQVNWKRHPICTHTFLLQSFGGLAYSLPSSRCILFGTPSLSIAFVRTFCASFALLIHILALLQWELIGFKWIFKFWGGGCWLAMEGSNMGCTGMVVDPAAFRGQLFACSAGIRIWQIDSCLSAFIHRGSGWDECCIAVFGLQMQW